MPTDDQDSPACIRTDPHLKHIAGPDPYGGLIMCPGVPEPSAAPAEAAQEPAADAAPTTATPDASGGHTAILGRALLDEDGEIWHLNGAGDLWLTDLTEHAAAATREEIERQVGPVREVLLADPTVAQVLEAAQRLRQAGSVRAAERAEEALVAAAVDAAEAGGGKPTWAEAASQVAADVERLEARRSSLAEREAAPEPAGDGPGWDRAFVDAFIGELEPESQRQITALLADRDREREWHEHYRQMYTTAAQQRNAARAELAEVTDQLRKEAADRDRLSGELAEVRAERDQLREALRRHQWREDFERTHQKARALLDTGIPPLSEPIQRLWDEFHERHRRGEVREGSGDE